MPGVVLAWPRKLLLSKRKASDASLKASEGRNVLSNLEKVFDMNIVVL